MKTPLLLLTGFLGSGKTTLLNRLLRDPDWAESAVIVNEFGDIALDHVLIEHARDNVLLLDSGCLCCEITDSLGATLANLAGARARGAVPPFRRALVETSGLAEPSPILRALLRDKTASYFYGLRGVFCAVDSVFGLEALDARPEARAQAACADRLIVTKSDCANGPPLAALTAKLTALNPHASIVDAHHHAAAALFAITADAPWAEQIRSADGHDHAHSENVASASFVIARPVTWVGMAAWIDAIRARYGAALWRCKGLMNVAGESVPVALHGVQTVFDTKRLSAWPDEERRSRLVLIGEYLDDNHLANSLVLLSDG